MINESSKVTITNKKIPRCEFYFISNPRVTEVRENFFLSAIFVLKGFKNFSLHRILKRVRSFLVAILFGSIFTKLFT